MSNDGAISLSISRPGVVEVMSWTPGDMSFGKSPESLALLRLFEALLGSWSVQTPSVQSS